MLDDDQRTQVRGRVTPILGMWNRVLAMTDHEDDCDCEDTAELLEMAAEILTDAAAKVRDLEHRLAVLQAVVNAKPTTLEPN